MTHKPSLEAPLIQNNLDVSTFVGEQAVSLTPTEQLLLVHAPTVLGTIREDVFQTEGGTGTQDGLQWERSELIGKQQPVALVDITLPDGSVIPTVFRPSHGKFREYYEQYPTIRELYPKLYMATTVPYYRETTQEVLVIEKLTGFHGDYQKNPTQKEYAELVAAPDGFEQMCQEAFQAIEKIHALPFAIWDMDPRVGHNFIFNTKAEHFQPFDIDILHPSNEPPAKKFLRLIQANIQPGNSLDASVKYAMRMIQLYAEAHPDADFTYEEPHTYPSYAFTDELYPAEGTVLYPGAEDYEKAFRTKMKGKWHMLGSRALGWDEDYPSFVKTVKHGMNVTIVDPDMLAAIKVNDAAKLKELILASNQSNYHKLEKTEFVETRE